MNIDFTLILTLLTITAAVVLVIDRIFFFTKRQERVIAIEFAELNKLARRDISKTDLAKIRKKAEPKIVETARSFFPILAVVLVIRSFFFEPYQIPSGSMLPTLKIGDFILVDKFTFGVRLPVLNSLILEGRDPKRGEVLVFRAPFDPATSYIKRVIGLPGDQIRIDGNKLFVNNRPVAQGLTEQITDNEQQSIFTQTLDDIEYTLIPLPVNTRGSAAWTVPNDSYFVMGDNRPNSYDSRFWGFVPQSHLVGRAVVVWMHWPRLLSIPRFQLRYIIQKN